jgi:hypothetical protein
MVMVVMMSLVACAGVQGKWNALTPDEKARVVIGDIQDQLAITFDTAKAQIGNKPEWREKVVPAFDVANKALADVIILGKTKPLTPAMVYEKVQNQVTNVLNLCIQLGWVKK